MRTVSVRYHCEPSGWWAESSDLPGLSVAGATFNEVRLLAFQGVEFSVGEPVIIVEEAVMYTDWRSSGNPGSFFTDLTTVGS